MSTDTKYNGWSNYETWLVNLWLSNDQGSDEYWREQAQYAWDNALRLRQYSDQTRENAARNALSEMLKDEHEAQAEELVKSTGVFADLVSGALGRVEWREIAEHLLEDVDKSNSNEDEDTEDELEAAH